MRRNKGIFGAIVFIIPKDAVSLPKNITYKVRLRSDKWFSGINDGMKVAFWKRIDWKTGATFSDLNYPGPREGNNRFGGEEPGIFICK